MQNVKKSDLKTYDLQVQKVIAKPPADVFRALSEGRLFLNCSADSESIKVDFRVGGKYSIEFASYNMSNHGAFLEIVPNQKIVFTWCQNGQKDSTPDTTVTIVLKPEGSKTLLTLTHAGFTDKETMKDHQGGWNGGLDDLSTEITQGKLRFNRLFQVPVQKLYEKCQDPASFFGLIGDFKKGQVDFKEGGTFQVPTKKGEVSGRFIKIVPNEKIVFSWNSNCGDQPTVNSQVTLNFESDDDSSWLELIHEGLAAESQQKSHREAWDWVINRMRG